MARARDHTTLANRSTALSARATWPSGIRTTPSICGPLPPTHWPVGVLIDSPASPPQPQNSNSAASADTARTRATHVPSPIPALRIPTTRASEYIDLQLESRTRTTPIGQWIRAIRVEIWDEAAFTDRK